MPSTSITPHGIRTTVHAKTRTAHTKNNTAPTTNAKQLDRLAAWHRAVGWHAELAQDLRDGRAALNSKSRQLASHLDRIRTKWETIGNPYCFESALALTRNCTFVQIMASLRLDQTRSAAYAQRGLAQQIIDAMGHAPSPLVIYMSATEHELTDFAKTARYEYGMPMERLTVELSKQLARRYSALWNTVPVAWHMPFLSEAVKEAVIAGSWDAAADMLLYPFQRPRWPGHTPVQTYVGRLPAQKAPTSDDWPWPNDGPAFELEEALGVDAEGNNLATFWTEASKRYPQLVMVQFFDCWTTLTEFQKASAMAWQQDVAPLHRSVNRRGQPAKVVQRLALYRLRWEWARMRKQCGKSASDYMFCKVIDAEMQNIPSNVVHELAPHLEWFKQLSESSRLARLHDRLSQALLPDPTVPPLAEYLRQSATLTIK